MWVLRHGGIQPGMGGDDSAPGPLHVAMQRRAGQEEQVKALE